MSEDSLVKQGVAKGSALGGAVLLITVGVLEILQASRDIGGRRDSRRPGIHVPIRPHFVGDGSTRTRCARHRCRNHALHRRDVGTGRRDSHLFSVDPREFPVATPHSPWWSIIIIALDVFVIWPSRPGIPRSSEVTRRIIFAVQHFNCAPVVSVPGGPSWQTARATDHSRRTNVPN